MYMYKQLCTIDIVDLEQEAQLVFGRAFHQQCQRLRKLLHVQCAGLLRVEYVKESVAEKRLQNEMHNMITRKSRNS